MEQIFSLYHQCQCLSAPSFAFSEVEVFFQYPTIYSLSEFLLQEQSALPAVKGDIEQRAAVRENHNDAMLQHRRARLRSRLSERIEDDI